MSARNADDVPDAVADQMDSYRMPPIDAVTAERLVAGDRADRESLADLLALAARPAIPAELAGEQRAMSAFRRARDAAVSGGPARTRNLARWLTVKAAALALAGTATGVALAAATGVLPNPLDGAPQVSTGTAAPSHDQSTTTPPAAGAGNATPAVSLLGLCTAYEVAFDTNGDRALDDPAFALLVLTAGARDAVPGLCDALLRDSSGTDVDAGAPTGPSGGQGNPSRPTGLPNPHPTGPPSPHPTGPPNPHPTGIPTNAAPVVQASPNVQIGAQAGAGPEAGSGLAQAGPSGSGILSNAQGPRGADEGGAARRT